MASNVGEEPDDEVMPSEESISRWQMLFGYSQAEAVEQIMNQNSDYTRQPVSGDHWNLVKSTMEAQGFDREAYEHWLRLGRPQSDSPHHHEQGDTDATSPPLSDDLFLIKLEGYYLSTPQRLQEIAQLTEEPHTNVGISDHGTTLFCRIDGYARRSVEKWAFMQTPKFKPVFIPVNLAKKDLSPDSLYPTLGRDPTLPQYRPSSAIIRDLDTNSVSHSTFSQGTTPSCPVLQDEYPVWYFFYGTLAEPDRLTSVLSLPEAESPPVLIPASVSGGVIKSWRGKYRALVDGGDSDVVHGSAYMVTSEEREIALRIYENKSYEVVRCTIVMASQTAQGLTFRFRGSL
ncbi:hypothetical protein Q9189_001845 [Teloschistes chrysophthalmus]